MVKKFILIAAAIFFSVQMSAQNFSVSQSSINFPSFGAGGYNVLIKSVIDWVAVCDAKWVSTMISGKANDPRSELVLVLVDYNYSLIPRSTTITYYNVGKTVILGTLEVSQSALGCTDPNSLNYDPNADHRPAYCFNVSGDIPSMIEAEGGDISFTVSPGDLINNWKTTITPNIEGFLLKPSQFHGFHGLSSQCLIHVPFNESPEEREFTITFTTITDFVSTPQVEAVLGTLTIKQAGYIPIIYGCMEENAMNYNPEATAESQNFPCLYPLTFDETSLNFGAKGGFQVIIADGATATWAANSSEQWVNVAPIMGSNGRVTFTAQPNLQTEPRSAIVTFVNGDYELGSVEITQAAHIRQGCMDPDAVNYDPEAGEDDGSCMPPFLTADLRMPSFEAEGGSSFGMVMSNVPWSTIVTPSTGLSINPPQGFAGSQSEFTVVVDANPNTTEREFAIVFFYGSTPMDTVIITQNGKTEDIIYGCTDNTALNYNPAATLQPATYNPCIYGITLSETSFTFTAEGGSQQTILEGGYGWTTYSDAEWANFYFYPIEVY